MTEVTCTARLLSMSFSNMREGSLNVVLSCRRAVIDGLAIG